MLQLDSSKWQARLEVIRLKDLYPLYEGTKFLKNTRLIEPRIDMKKRAELENSFCSSSSRLSVASMEEDMIVLIHGRMKKHITIMLSCGITGNPI